MDSLFADESNDQTSQELNVVGVVGSGTEDHSVEGVAESHPEPTSVAQPLPMSMDRVEEDVLVNSQAIQQLRARRRSTQSSSTAPQVSSNAPVSLKSMQLALKRVLR